MNPIPRRHQRYTEEQLERRAERVALAFAKKYGKAARCAFCRCPVLFTREQTRAGVLRAIKLEVVPRGAKGTHNLQAQLFGGEPVAVEMSGGRFRDHATRCRA
jgi:hypothetical protein